MSKEFDKYQTIGPDYHYRQIDRGSLRDYNAAVDARFQKLVDNVGIETGERVLKLLDVGCGDGAALYLLSRKSLQLELYGVDSAEDALEVARERVPEGKFLAGLAEKLPFENGFFDIAISSDVIEHVDNAGRMLAEIKRVTKDGATIIIGTPIRHSKFPLDHNHVQEWFVEDFKNLLEPHFKDIGVHESHNLIPTLLYSKPTRSVFNFKYLINLLSLIFGYNPFLAERQNKMQMFAYMYAICRK